MPPREVMIFAYRFRWPLWAVGGVSLALISVVALLGFLPTAWLLLALATGAFAFWWGAYVPVVMGYPDRVRTLSSADADQLLRAEDEVLGLEIGGEARAYPGASITRPHLHYDTVGGTPVTVTYCILCNSGVAFRSEFDRAPAPTLPHHRVQQQHHFLRWRAGKLHPAARGSGDRRSRRRTSSYRRFRSC